MIIKKAVPVIVSLILMVCVIGISAVYNKGNAPTKRNAISVLNNNTNSRNSASTEDTVNPTGEMRGIWISYMELSMENETDKSVDSFKKKFARIADNCKNRGFNTLVVQVRPFCDALYKSEYFPYSHILTGTQGKNPGYDPLKIMCEICKKNGLSIHAWINPYRIATNNVPDKLSEDNPYKKDCNLGIKTDNGIYLDPSSKKARDLIVNGIIEIIKSYEVDGIQFDDYFYPTQNEDFDRAQYMEYTDNSAGGIMSLENWRKANVNMLICDCYRTIHKTKNNVVFGISPQGNIDNNESLYADVKIWCTCKGFADYICPQIYFSLENPALSFDEALESWTKLDFADNVKLYVGLAGYKAGTDADNNTWQDKNDILSKEYSILKNNNKVNGFMLYSYASLENNDSKEEIDNLQKELH